MVYYIFSGGILRYRKRDAEFFLLFSCSILLVLLFNKSETKQVITTKNFNVMNKLMNLKTLLLLSLVTFLVSSCDDDPNPYEVPYITFGEVVKTETNTVIESDLGNTLVVSNPQIFERAKVEDGDRIYGVFHFVEPKGNDKDSKVIELGFVYKILTKDIVALTPENEKEISDDAIAPVDLWISGEYLNFNYTFFTDGMTTHYLNMVTVDNPKKQEDGYQYVEIRHNANYDYDRFVGQYTGIVSFDIDDIVKENPGLKGFIVRIKTTSVGERFYKVNLKEKDAERQVDGLDAAKSDAVK